MSTPGTQPNQSFSCLFKLFLEEQQNNPEDCWLALVDPPDIDELTASEFAGWMNRNLYLWLWNNDVCVAFGVEDILNKIREERFGKDLRDSQDAG